MKFEEFLEEVLLELSVRVNEGTPNLKNPKHIQILSEIFDELELYEIKNEVISNLLNEDTFRNPILNRTVTYKDKDNNEKEGLVGNLLRLKKDTPGRDAAERVLSRVSDEDRKEINKELGGDTPQNQPQDGGDKQPTKGEEPQQQEPQQNVSGPDAYSHAADVKKDKKTSKEVEREIQRNLSSEQKSARGLLKKLDVEQVKIDNPDLTDEELDHIQNFRNSLDELLNNQTSEERKRELANQLKDDYGLTTNTSTVDEEGNPKKVKLYIKKNFDGGKVSRNIETVLGGGKSWNATNPMTNLVNELNNYLDEGNKIQPNSIGGKSESALKVEFEKAAKPSFKIEGGKTKREKTRQNPITKGKRKDPNNPGYDVDGNPLTITDPLVSQIFKPNTVLGDLKESMHSIEGPADDDGNLIPCDSSENKRKHFDFLVNSNESTQRVKQAAQKYINDPNVSESDKEKFRKVIKSIDDYETGMNKVLDNVPSKEAEKEVKRLNARLMDDLHNSFPDIASGMAKQFAENALVTQEIAAGDEVYMPSQGTFPGGDKILVTRNGAVMEAVAGVSVKFGRASKNTQIYGFPGEAQSMANFAEIDKRPDETDEQYEQRKQDVRTRNGKYVGQDGYLLGVRDDIINDENKFNEVLTQSELDEAVTDKKKLHELNKEIHTEIERYIEEQRKLGRSEKAIRIALQKHMKGWMKENNIQNRFEECVDRSKLTEKMTGSTNGNYTDADGNEQKHDNTGLAQKCNPLEFMGITSFASSVREGKGMPSLLWNHQSYEDGEYHSETTDPADTDMTDLSNWGFSSRLWATSSRNGGGILATGTGEKKLRGKALRNTDTREKQ